MRLELRAEIVSQKKANKFALEIRNFTFLTIFSQFG